MPGSDAPLRERTNPNMSYSGSRLSIRLNTASYSATSTTWPRPPLAARACNAIKAPMTPYMAAILSPRLMPARTGGRSG